MARDVPHHHAYVRHQDWKKGYHIKTDDCGRGERVDDWHAHHLRKPPSGYEWREIDGNYVLANPDGVIFFHHRSATVSFVPQPQQQRAGAASPGVCLPVL